MDVIYRYDAVRSKFTGKERDTESSLDYFDARHYASSMGRFMTADQALTKPSLYRCLSQTSEIRRA